MWKCGTCGAVGPSSEGFVHLQTCFDKNDCRLFAVPPDIKPEEPSQEERRTRALEKAADALQHLATAHVDGMRAIEALVKIVIPIAEEAQRVIAEEAAARKDKKA